MKDNKSHDIKSPEKVNSKKGQLGPAKSDGSKKLDKGVKQTEEGKEFDIMKDPAIGKVPVNPKKPKLEITK